MKEILRRFASWCGFFRCPLCSENSGNGRNDICPECLEKLPLLPLENHCRACGGRNEGFLAVCSACAGFPQRPWLDAVTLMEYSGSGKKLIIDFKFNNRPELARPLAAMAVKALEESGMEYDAIVPVPLHWSRYLKRSYNQSELTASLIAQAVGKPMLRCLKRRYRAEKQSSLNREQRLKNLKKAFTVVNPEQLKNLNILLVDDVLTTGATLSAAAELLLKNGAASVRVFSCARTPVKS